MFVLREKNAANIIPLIKKHTVVGATLFSDSNLMYCSMNSGHSKLTQHGYYHMWTNHSFRMIHEKFTFNSIMNVELGWAHLKKICYTIKHTSNFQKI